MFNLIVTCVGSKNFEGPSIHDVIDVLLKQGINNDVEALFATWKNKLTEHKSISHRTQAAYVYKGPVWNPSIEAFEMIKGPRNLWIISCGYGFINYKEEISGYHATFKPRVEDTLLRNDFFSAMGKKDVKKQWWNLLISKGIVDTNIPKSIHGLVNDSKADDVVMLAAGSDYIEAIYDDIAMIDISDHMPKLVLIGVQKSGDYYIPDVPKKIRPFVIPYSDGRKLREFLGCGAIQIHPKTASLLINKYNKTGKIEFDLP